MRTIIKSLIVASALVTGGSAFANDSSDNTLSQAIAQSQIAFAAQSATRHVIEHPVAAPRLTSQAPVRRGLAPATLQQAAISQGFAPVDTQELLHGFNR
jgi:hypothetical protein